MSKIVKNTTGSAILFDEVGIEVPASGQYVVNPTEYLIWAERISGSSFETAITNGDIVVNDGVQDLTVANGVSLSRAIDFLRYPDTAFNQRFLSDPERANGLESKNTQEAIEEVQSIAEPLVVPISLIYNGTLSNGDWIGYSNLLPGDATPVICPIDGKFVGFTWSNSKNDADFALEFRKNSLVATPFFTWSVDNTQFANVDLPSPEIFSQGDQIYIKYVDEGTNASDATIVLKFRS